MASFSSRGLLGRQRVFRPERIPTEGSRRGPGRNKARLQRWRKPNPAASLQPAQSWWISLGSQITRTDGAEAACHRTYGLVLGANLNCSESWLSNDIKGFTQARFRGFYRFLQIAGAPRALGRQRAHWREVKKVPKATHRGGPKMSPWLRSEQPLAIIPSRACQQGGSHAAPLRRPGTRPPRVPGRGTGQLAVQARNRDRPLRRRRQYRCSRSDLFSAAIRASRPAVRDRKSGGRRKHNRYHELGEGRTGRLHDRRWHLRWPCHQSGDHEGKPRLQGRQGLRLSSPDGYSAQLARSASLRPGKKPPGVHRLG